MQEHPIKINRLVDHLFRHESGRMISVLTKILGMRNLDIAQDIVQDALLKAMNAWRYGKIPDNPSAWLFTVARNKAIDVLRAQRFTMSLEYSNADAGLTVATPEEFFLEGEIQDSQLRMIFACCHPAIAEESQIAVALKTLCGLSVSEIGKAFLVSEDVIAKRIYRAKEKMQQEKIELEIPAGANLQPRLENVLRVIYAMFNEGYNSSHPDALIRIDICAEAMRLCHLLTLQFNTNTAATKALLALLCFQSSRFDARIGDRGNIITLRYQDRSKWNHQLIRQGMDYLNEAIEENAYSVYHLEAAIASMHASVPTFEETDWKSVFHLYDTLYAMKPSPIVALNKAIASSYAVSKQSGLDMLREIRGLENHYLYHAALGEVFLALDKMTDARSHFKKAVALTSSRAEQQFLMEKLSQCQERC